MTSIERTQIGDESEASYDKENNGKSFSSNSNRFRPIEYHFLFCFTDPNGADATENASFLFPKYPNTFGSFLNTSSVFNYRSPHTNENANVDAPIDDAFGKCGT